MFSYQFKPTLIPTLLTLLLLPLFVSLGFWQLQRGHEKQEINALLELQFKKNHVPLTELPSNEKTWQYLPVKVIGYFNNTQQFLLDNKIHKGQVGYEVITPMLIKGLQKMVLVDRGGIASNSSRELLPELQAVTAEQTFNGILSLSFGKSLMLAADQFDKHSWPIRIQQVDYSKLEQALGKPLYHFIVLMDPQAAHGYTRDWKFVNGTPQKHVGYALQWFSFAAILFILYLVLNLHKKPRHQR